MPFLIKEAKPELCKPLKKDALPPIEEYLKTYFANKKEA